MINSKQLDDAARDILSKKRRVNQWALMRAVGQELNVRHPTYNLLFRAQLALHMHRLGKSGAVIPERKTIKVAGHNISFFSYRLPDNAPAPGQAA